MPWSWCLFTSMKQQLRQLSTGYLQHPNEPKTKILGLKVDLRLCHWNLLFYDSETELRGTDYVGYSFIEVWGLLQIFWVTFASDSIRRVYPQWLLSSYVFFSQEKTCPHYVIGKQKSKSGDKHAKKYFLYQIFCTWREQLLLVRNTKCYRWESI